MGHEIYNSAACFGILQVWRECQCFAGLLCMHAAPYLIVGGQISFLVGIIMQFCAQYNATLTWDALVVVLQDQSVLVTQ